jgi:phosphoribosylanthranilate isomerase/indole-3-glycerol phosphate synthase/phosphoribosylanthranilate isomerase
MNTRIQIKICGLTKVDQALGCVDLGADAIGLVFYPKSPRFVNDALAREIAGAVSTAARVTGVFVDENYTSIMRKVEKCGLTAVQLHGRETAELVQEIKRSGVTVIKALFNRREPSFLSSVRYYPSAFILECGGGRLPGGNAETWDWSAAAVIERQLPIVLAGGLSAENALAAVTAGKPDAVDVSSGVETAPGDKDLNKVKAFLAAVDEAAAGIDYQTKKLF